MQQRKLAQCKKFAKLGLIFCKIRNKLSRICQRLVKLCQSGEMPPNLVTLQSSNLKKTFCWKLHRDDFNFNKILQNFNFQVENSFDEEEETKNVVSHSTSRWH